VAVSGVMAPRQPAIGYRTGFIAMPTQPVINAFKTQQNANFDRKLANF